MRRLTFTALFLLAALAPAFAEVRILSSAGGEVTEYLRLFAAVRATGERVVIDGPCLSACTLLLSTIPNNRICVTRRAVLGFHAARAVDRQGRIYAAPEATRVTALHQFYLQVPLSFQAERGISSLIQGRPITWDSSPGSD